MLRGVSKTNSGQVVDEHCTAALNCDPSIGAAAPGMDTVVCTGRPQLRLATDDDVGRAGDRGSLYRMGAADVSM